MSQSKTQTATTKRINKITIQHMADEAADAGIANMMGLGTTIGIRAEAEVLIPLYEMHTSKCIELNEKRARYACECSSKDSLIQHLTSGGLWGIEMNGGTSRTWIADIEAEQLDELRRVLHIMGFSKRAVSAAFKTIERKSL